MEKRKISDSKLNEGQEKQTEILKRIKKNYTRYLFSMLVIQFLSILVSGLAQWPSPIGIPEYWFFMVKVFIAIFMLYRIAIVFVSFRGETKSMRRCQWQVMFFPTFLYLLIFCVFGLIGNKIGFVFFPANSTAYILSAGIVAAVGRLIVLFVWNKTYDKIARLSLWNV